jgi:hypothetical protein
MELSADFPAAVLAITDVAGSTSASAMDLTTPYLLVFMI